MILTALASYYDRTVGSPDGPPAFGYAEAQVTAALVIDDDGALTDIMDLRQQETRGKIRKLVPRTMVVPQPPKRSSGIDAAFLCDNAGYLLGFDGKGNAERARQQFEASRARHEHLLDGIDAREARAVRAFFRKWDPAGAAKIMADRPPELGTGWLVFYHERSGDYVHEVPAVRSAWERHFASTDAPRGQCLVSGERNAPIAVTHPAIKGIAGAQSSGASLVSFNQDAFTSYGKSQNLNAPISQRAAFAYTTALNHLTRRNSTQKILIGGDLTVLVWAERTTPAERSLVQALGGFSGEQRQSPTGLDALESAVDAVGPDEATARAGDQLRRIAAGRWSNEPDLGGEKDVRFHILGLAPNAARVQVRFFQIDTLGALLERIQTHCRDVLFENPETAREVPTLWKLARETLPKDDTGRTRADNSAGRSLDKLHGDLLRAVLSGHGYPQSLLSIILDRLRSDRQRTAARLGLVKACLNVERRRLRDPDKPEIPMSVDETNNESAYLLGRIFATLETMQELSREGRGQPTIADRLLGAASATPRTVFPHLLDLEKAHERKAKRLKAGIAFAASKKLGELIARVNAEEGFPAHLDTRGQGLFYIGYYQERQARFAGRGANGSDAASPPDQSEPHEEEE